MTNPTHTLATTTDEAVANLRRTFREYVKAEQRAMRVFVDYKFGLASEAQVALATRAEQVARDAHVEAMNNLGASSDESGECGR